MAEPLLYTIAATLLSSSFCHFNPEPPLFIRFRIRLYFFWNYGRRKAFPDSEDYASHADSKSRKRKWYAGNTGRAGHP